MGSPNETAPLLREWPMKSTDWRRVSRAFGLALGLLAALPGAASAGERLDGSELAATFSGMTLDGVYSSGDGFTETYRADHSILYVDANGVVSGKWSVKGDHFCTFYTGMDGGCFMIETNGANCFTFYVADPASGGVDQMQWNARGWDRDEGESTCPTVPERSV